MIIDCHQHIGEASNILGGSASKPRVDYLAWDAETRSRYNDAMGVAQVVVMPSFEYTVFDGTASVRSVNDFVAAYVERYAFAVAGLGVVDPLADPDPAAEFERVVNTLGLSGIAFHGRFQRLASNAHRVRAVLADAPARTRVVAVHCVGESRMEAPWRLADLALQFPNLNFLALSPLTAHTQCEEMMFLCKLAPNIFVDLAGVSHLGTWIEQFVSAIGSNRLLFGSDLYVDPPIFRHCPVPNLIDAAHISTGDKENIMFRNAIDLFGLEHVAT